MDKSIKMITMCGLVYQRRRLIAVVAVMIAIAVAGVWYVFQLSDAQDLWTYRETVTLSAGEEYYVPVPPYRKDANLRLYYSATGSISYSIKYGVKVVAKGSCDQSCVSVSYRVIERFEVKFENKNPYEVRVDYKVELSVQAELETCD